MIPDRVFQSPPYFDEVVAVARGVLESVLGIATSEVAVPAEAELPGRGVSVTMRSREGAWLVSVLASEACGTRLVQRLFGPSSGESSDGEIDDVLGELANMISGGAKARISEDVGEVLELSLPVPFGESSPRAAADLGRVSWLGTELGDLLVEVGFNRVSEGGQE